MNRRRFLSALGIVASSTAVAAASGDGRLAAAKAKLAFYKRQIADKLAPTPKAPLVVAEGTHVLSAEQMSSYEYRSWRASHETGLKGHPIKRVAAEARVPICPLCGDYFPAPDRESLFDCKPRMITCGGRREVVEPVAEGETPIYGRVIPCGWTGEALFSRRQA